MPLKTIIADKAVYLLALLGGFLAPVAGMFYLVLFLVFGDMITAIIADMRAKKTKKFNTIRSRKLRRTAIKLFLYWLFIMACYAIPMVCFGSPYFMVNIATAMICVIELKSIAENSGLILGNDILMRVFKRFRKGIENIINKGIEEPE